MTTDTNERPTEITALQARKFDQMLFTAIRLFHIDDGRYERHMEEISLLCSDEQWDIVCNTMDMIRDPNFIKGELPADYDMVVSHHIAPAASDAPAPVTGGTITRNTLEYEIWAHAACLTIAEGSKERPPIELQSAAIQAVIKLADDNEALRQRLQASEKRERGLREALKPFADQMRFFKELAKAQGRYEPTYLMDKRLRSFENTSLTLIANPINALSVSDFEQASAADATGGGGGTGE